MTEREEIHELRQRLQGALADVESRDRLITKLTHNGNLLEQELERRDARIRALEVDLRHLVREVG